MLAQALNAKVTLHPDLRIDGCAANGSRLFCHHQYSWGSAVADRGGMLECFLAARGGRAGFQHVKIGKLTSDMRW